MNRDEVLSDDRLRVVSLDPGGTTGCAWATVERGRVIPSIAETLGVRQVRTRGREDDGTWELAELVDEIEPHVLVMEDFRLFVGDKQQTSDTDGLSPVRIIARLDLLWWMGWKAGADVGMAGTFGVQLPLVVKQMPGERKVVKDDWLRKEGLWRTEKRQSGGPHAMDALRHLIVFARRWVR